MFKNEQNIAIELKGNEKKLGQCFLHGEDIFMVQMSIGMVNSLASAPLQEVIFDGKQILIVKRGENFFALGNVCTHRGCRLSGGTLDGETVRCPCHGSGFNIKTGEVVHGPAKNPEPVYRITVEKEELFIDL
jgi:nitrite reductase/ring-hydroxylating ferredoxin subunit